MPLLGTPVAGTQAAGTATRPAPLPTPSGTAAPPLSLPAASGTDTLATAAVVIGTLTSCLTSITTFIGFIWTTVAGLRKESQDALAADLERKRQELELDKQRFELEKAREELKRANQRPQGDNPGQ